MLLVLQIEDGLLSRAEDSRAIRVLGQGITEQGRDEGLRCGVAKVDASSGASADAFATQDADGRASSGASVTFHGSPAQFHEDSSSGGSVHAR